MVENSVPTNECAAVANACVRYEKEVWVNKCHQIAFKIVGSVPNVVIFVRPGVTTTGIN